MPAVSAEHLAMLKTVLDRDFVPYLTPLINPLANEDQNRIKNQSRAYSGFALKALCGVNADIASKDVVDDFDDEGIDAIHYCQANETIYLVQTKLRETEKFGQTEAQAFCIGIRKLLRHDFTHFNEHVQIRKTEIEGALDDCKRIQIVVAHVGTGLSEHAKRALQELLADETIGERERLQAYIDFDAERTVSALQEAHAVQQITTTIHLAKWREVERPKRTYYGIVKLSALVDLHIKYGDSLFNKNIRSFLGHDTDVNQSILSTLINDCSRFFYLNNGVTVLCNRLTTQGNPKDVQRLRTDGLSVINGAQTIATASKYVSENPGSDISEAQILLTIVEVDDSDDFGSDITKARNHQNAVSTGDFTALDAEQERLRREIANLGVFYTYKAIGADRNPSSTQIYVDEASQALLCIQKDPKYTASLKDKPIDFLDIQKAHYKRIFNSSVTPYQIVNAVKFNRYVQERIGTEAGAANGNERLTYRNGKYLLAWLLAKHCMNSILRAQVIDETKLPSKLSKSFDDLRQVFSEETEKIIGENSYSAFFKNQSQVKSLAKLIMIRHFAIVVDEGMRRFEEANPDRYLEHLTTLAPQIDLHE